VTGAVMISSKTRCCAVISVVMASSTTRKSLHAASGCG
jgi:hypothetical protein